MCFSACFSKYKKIMDEYQSEERRTKEIKRGLYKMGDHKGNKFTKAINETLGTK